MFPLKSYRKVIVGLSFHYLWVAFPKGDSGRASYGILHALGVFFRNRNVKIDFRTFWRAQASPGKGFLKGIFVTPDKFS